MIIVKSIKRVLCLVLIAVVTLSFVPATVAADNPSIVFKIDHGRMLVNGSLTDVDPGYSTVPVIRNGSTLVPIRRVTETFGGSASWDGNARAATLVLGPKTVVLTIGSKTATINGTPTELLAAPELTGGRVFLPLRFVADQLGLDIHWDPANRLAMIALSDAKLINASLLIEDAARASWTGRWASGALTILTITNVDAKGFDFEAEGVNYHSYGYHMGHAEGRALFTGANSARWMSSELDAGLEFTMTAAGIEVEELENAYLLRGKYFSFDGSYRKLAEGETGLYRPDRATELALNKRVADFCDLGYARGNQSNAAKGYFTDIYIALNLRQYVHNANFGYYDYFVYATDIDAVAKTLFDDPKITHPYTTDDYVLYRNGAYYHYGMGLSMSAAQLVMMVDNGNGTFTGRWDVYADFWEYSREPYMAPGADGKYKTPEPHEYEVFLTVFATFRPTDRGWLLCSIYAS